MYWKWSPIQEKSINFVWFPTTQLYEAEEALQLEFAWESSWSSECEVIKMIIHCKIWPQSHLLISRVSVRSAALSSRHALHWWWNCSAERGIRNIGKYSSLIGWQNCYSSLIGCCRWIKSNQSSRKSEMMLISEIQAQSKKYLSLIIFLHINVCRPGKCSVKKLLKGHINKVTCVHFSGDSRYNYNYFLCVGFNTEIFSSLF